MAYVILYDEKEKFNSYFIIKPQETEDNIVVECNYYLKFPLTLRAEVD